MFSIISKYIIRSFLQTFLVIFSVLFLAFFFLRSIDFLEIAARGDMYPQIALGYIFFNIPSVIEIILPLSIFLSTLICIARMNTSNEINFMRQMGLKSGNFLKILAIPILLMSFFALFISLIVSPYSLDSLYKLTSNQTFSDRFKMMGAGKPTYFEDVNTTFFAKESNDFDFGFSEIFASIEHEDMEIILTADQVSSIPTDKSTNRLTFKNGKIVGLEMEGDFLMNFSHLEFTFPRKIKTSSTDLSHLSLTSLISNLENNREQSELFKRLSIFVLIIVSAFVALNFGISNHRIGFTVSLITGSLFFLLYFGIYLGMQNWTLSSEYNPSISFAAFHFVFFLAGIFLSYFLNKESPINIYSSGVSSINNFQLIFNLVLLAFVIYMFFYFLI